MFDLERWYYYDDGNEIIISILTKNRNLYLYLYLLLLGEDIGIKRTRE